MDCKHRLKFSLQTLSPRKSDLSLKFSSSKMCDLVAKHWENFYTTSHIQEKDSLTCV